MVDNRAQILSRQRQELAEKRARREMELSLEQSEGEDKKDESNFFEKLGSTLWDVGGNFLEGIVKTGEGIVDAGAGIVGEVGGIFDKDFKNDVADFVKKDGAGAFADWAEIDEAEENSFLNDMGFGGEVVRDISSGVGGMMPALALSFIPGVGPVLSTAITGVSAAGNAFEGALNEGADYDKALAYGAIAGGVEAGTEKIGGFVFGDGTSLIGKKLAGTALGNATSKGIGKVALDFASEAGEEVLADVIDPLNRAITGVDTNIGKNYKEVIKNLPKTALVGGTVGTIVQGGTAGFQSISNAVRKRGGARATSADNSIKYIQEVSQNYGADEVQNTKNDQAIKMSLEDVSKQITKLDSEQRQNYLESIDVYKNAFDDTGKLKETLVNPDTNAEAVSNSVRPISATVKYAPVKASEQVSESAKVAKATVEKLIGTGANVVVTNEAVQGDALYNPDDKVIYINNNTEITEDKISKAVALHEVTHTTEGTKAYSKLVKVLEDVVNDKNAPAEVKAIVGDVKSRTDRIETDYSEQIDGLSNDLQKRVLVETELHADLVGELLSNDYFIEKLAIRDEGLLKKLYHSIKNKANAKKSELGPDGVKYLNKLANKFAKAIDKRAGGIKLSDLGSDEEREEKNKFGNGENANYSDKFGNNGFVNDERGYLHTVTRKIEPNMSDLERYEILKDRNIELTAEVDKLEMTDVQKRLNFTEDSFNLEKFADKRNLIIKIGEEFGVFKKYKNQDLQLSFQYSKNNAREGINKQRKQYFDFVKMLSCLDAVIDNAIGIEAHNRNEEHYKEDKTLNEVYVLASAFVDGEEIVPVKLEIKEFTDKENSLYVAIALDKIKKDGVVVQEVAQDSVAQQDTRPSKISISEFFKNINPQDESFYKYIPKQFLSVEDNDVRYSKKTTSSKDKFTIGRGTAMRLAEDLVKGYDEGTLTAEEATRKLKAIGFVTDVNESTALDVLDEHIGEIREFAITEREAYRKASKEKAESTKLRTETRYEDNDPISEEDAERYRRESWEGEATRLKMSVEEAKSLGIQEENPQILQNMGELAEMESVLAVDAKKLEKTGKSPKELYVEFFSSIGNRIQSDRFGDISLPNSSIRSEIRHGTTAEKLATLEAIPEVIEKGKVIFDREKESGVRRFVVCAPINIGRKSYYMGVMLQKDSNHQRLYLHNVVSLEMKREALSSEKADLVTTGAQTKDDLSMTSILQNALKVKFSKQKNTSYTSKKMIKSLIEDAVDSYAIFNEDSENVAFMPKDSKQDVISAIWKQINSTKEYNKKNFANYVSKKIMESIVLGDSEIYKARDALKSFMHKIDISDVYEELGAKQKNKFNSRWALKDGNETISFDEVISKIRDLGYMIESNNKLSALLELNSIYEHTQRYINEEQGVRLAERMGKEKYKEMLSKISKELYSTLESNQTENELATKLVHVIEKSQEELEKYREYKKEFTHDEKRETAIGVLRYNVTEIVNIKNHKYAKALQIFFDEFLGIQKDIGKLLVRGNINKSSARKIAASLSSWYTNKNEMLGDYFNQEIADKISNFKSTKDIKGTLSITEIWDLVQITTHLKNFFKNYGKIWRGGKLVEIKELAENEFNILNNAADSKTAMYNILAYNNKYFLTPDTVSTLVEGQDSDGELQRHVKELQSAEINRDYECMEVFEKVANLTNSKRKITYKGKTITCKKLFDRILSEKETIKCGLKVDFRELIVQEVDIPIVKAMEIWLSAKTDKTNRIQNVGIALKNQLGTKYTFMHPISEEQIETMFNRFPEPVQELTLFIQKWMNNEGRKIKYDADIQKQGYSNLIEGIYHNLEVYHFEDGKSLEQIFNTRALGNYSFDKERVKRANSIIVIDNAVEKFFNHVRELNTKKFVDPIISNFDKVMQWNIADVGEKSKTAKMLLESEGYFGGYTKEGKKKSLYDYFVLLHKDVEGIREGQEPAMSVFAKLRGAYASTVLGANIKVLCTQLSSVIASVAELNPVTLIRTLNPVHLGKDVINRVKGNDSEAAKYSKWAKVRRYDQNVAKAMTLMETISDKMNVFTAGIGLVDSLIVDAEFHQCERQAQLKYNLPIGSEENKIKAGELLTELGMKTQQNHYASTRSEIMRSKNEFVKFFAAFKTDANMIISGFVKNVVGVGQVDKQIKSAKKKENSEKVKLLENRKKELLSKSAKYTTVILLQCAYMTLLTRLFNKLYGQDEDDEMTALDIALDMLGAFNGMMPIVSEISSFFIDGYDVNNSFYSMLNNALDSVVGIVDNVNDAIDGKEVSSQRLASSLRKSIYSIGAFFGIPAKNIYKNCKAVIDICSKSVGNTIDSWFNEPSKKEITDGLSDALKTEDTQGSNTYYELLYNYHDISLEDNVLKNELNRLIKLDVTKNSTDNGNYNPLGSKIPDILKINGEEVELSLKDKNVFKNGLKLAERDGAKAVKTLMYKKLDNESKAYCIRTVYNYHHQVSLESMTKEKSKLAYYGDVIDINTLALILAFAKNAEADNLQSRREKIEAYIKGFGLNSIKTSLALRCLGYSDKQNDERVSNYINNLRGLTQDQKKAFLSYAKA